MNPIYRSRSSRHLSSIRGGEKVVVKAVAGGRDLTRRLREMGIHEGVKIEVAQNTGGPVIIILGNSRMALGQGMAGKILVE